MPFIFLSHHNTDKPLVESFIRQLEQRPLARQYNLKVWLDKTHLEHGRDFTGQFSQYINHPDTCAFMLFMPQDAIRSAVDYEIGTAFNRYLNDKNAGKHFPILPVYPGAAAGRVPLPEIIRIFNYRETVFDDPEQLDLIVRDALSALIGGHEASPSDSTDENHIQTPANNLQQHGQTSGGTPWYSFSIERRGNKLEAEDDSGNRFVLPVSDLAEFSHSSHCLHDLAGWLFNACPINLSKPSRLRIMCDDAELSMLPWHELPDPDNAQKLTELGWTIENGPLQGRHYQREFVSFNPQSPLLAIPAEDTHDITADSHYRVVQSDLEAYLDVRGLIPRVKCPHTLHQELKLQQPDLIYIYARFDGQYILLDRGRSGSNRLTLDELGEWIDETGIFPIVVLSLVGSHLKHYPTTLARHSRLLWVQSTSRDHAPAVEKLRRRLADVMLGLAKNADLSSLILQQISQSAVGLHSHLWLNGKSLSLTTDNSADKQKQRIRAALLRVSLGREQLKDRLAGGISAQTAPLLSYAVTGQADACPHDVPEQVRQRLQWDNIRNSLPVVSYYFHVEVGSQPDLYNQLDRVISNSMLCGYDDTENIIRQELERRGLNGQPCCISLNWLLQVDEQAAPSIEQWLEDWGRLICEYFGPVHLEPVTIVNAICLQVSRQVDPGPVHEAVNRTLRRRLRNQRECNIEPLICDDALGHLKSGEIEDFLEKDVRYWFRELKLGEQGETIESWAFADWVIAQTDGKFEDTVQIIWQQYQHDYRDYLNHEQSI